MRELLWVGPSLVIWSDGYGYGWHEYSTFSSERSYCFESIDAANQQVIRDAREARALGLPVEIPEAVPVQCWPRAGQDEALAVMQRALADENRYYCPEFQLQDVLTTSWGHTVVGAFVPKPGIVPDDWWDPEDNGRIRVWNLDCSRLLKAYLRGVTRIWRPGQVPSGDAAKAGAPPEVVKLLTRLTAERWAALEQAEADRKAARRAELAAQFGVPAGGCDLGALQGDSPA